MIKRYSLRRLRYRSEIVLRIQFKVLGRLALLRDYQRLVIGAVAILEKNSTGTMDVEQLQ